ncbi:hypothetical protein D3C72_1979920 [compost metagenome]
MFVGGDVVDPFDQQFKVLIVHFEAWGIETPLRERHNPVRSITPCQQEVLLTGHQVGRAPARKIQRVLGDYLGHLLLQKK